MYTRKRDRKNTRADWYPNITLVQRLAQQAAIVVILYGDEAVNMRHDLCIHNKLSDTQRDN